MTAKWVVLTLFLIGGMARGDQAELSVTRAICQRELKLERLPVACLQLRKSSGHRCSQFHLRRTPAKRLVKAMSLKTVDPPCRIAIQKEVERRKYLNQQSVELKYGPSDPQPFFDRLPDIWQEN